MFPTKNDELTKQIIELSKKKEELKIEKLLEDKLFNDPEDIDILFRLACLEMYIPFVDYYATTIYLEKIIAISQKQHFIASSCLSYLEQGYPGGACLYPRLKQPIMWMCEVKRSWLTDKAIKQLIDNGKVDNPEETRTILEEKLQQNSNDIETLLLLALVELLCPDTNYGKSISFLKKILSISKETEAIAMIFLAFVKDWEGIDENLLYRLKNLSTNNPEINSMIKYMISVACGNYKINDAVLAEKYLKESIELYQGHARNYASLASIYKQQGKKAEADQLIQKAKSNVKVKYATEADFENYDPTNINDFLNEYINGTSSSHI